MLKRFIPNKLMRRLTYGFAVIFFIALLFFLLRGPYLSNSIKRIILPVLENAVGERIIIDKAVINLFPFYLQTKGFKVFDEEGNRLVWVTKMRAYIDLLGLFSKEIRIRRLTVKEPRLTMDRKVLEKMVRTTEKHTRKGNGSKFGVSLKSARISSGEFTLTDIEKQIGALARGIHMEIVVKDKVDISLLLKHGTLTLPDFPELTGRIEGRIEIAGKKIKISESRIFSSNSEVKAKGEIYPSSSGGVERGSFSGRARIFAKTIGKIFGLKSNKEGELSFSGVVELVPSKDINNDLKGLEAKLDLKTKGWFYLETLMELLKVDENIKGRVSLDGRIQGIYPELTGEGDLEAENVILDILPLDDVKGKIKYKDKKFTLNNAIAHTYSGELNGEAFFIIPDGDYFVDASVVDINSPQFFRFINWEPPFPEGRISGTFELNQKYNKAINLVAGATYVNTSENIENLTQDRLKTIEAALDIKEGILTFSRAVLYTPMSELFLDGTIDLNRERLSLNVEMQSRDVIDLTMPYFDGLSTPVSFTGKAEGSSAAPEISGKLKAGPGVVNGEPFTEITGDLSYSPELLVVSLLRARQGESVYEASGSIRFKEKSTLFSFESPFYDAKITVKDGNAKSLITAAYKNMPITGFVNGRMSFKGSKNEFKGTGDIILKNGVVYGQPFEQAVIKAEILPENINFSSVEVSEDKSNLKASGTLYFNNKFNVRVLSDNVNLGDIAILDKYPFDANFGLDVHGSGTFKNPNIEFSLNISKSYFREALIGKGYIKGGLEGKKLFVNGDFLGGVAAFDANVIFSESLPWNVDLKLKKGRYDFLLAGFLEDIPRDISASLEGDIRMKGKKKKFSMNSELSSLSFSLYGYNFRNKKDIVIDLTDDTLKVKSFSIRGSNGDITAAGTAKIGKSIDLKIDGKINLTPLKAITKTIKSLKGEGSFAVAISGPWKSPELRGEINIRNSTMMLAELPYRIGPVNGDIFFDKDRVTFDSFDADFAGGRVLMSGVGYLNELSLHRLSLASSMKGIKLRPSDGVNIVFDGEIFLEKSPGKQSLFGDINVKKAKYTRRVEWKSELLQPKQVKEALLKPSSFFSKTALNIYIKGQDNIFIDNNIARTPVKIDVNVQGTVAQYGLVGRVEARDGTIFFRGNEFEIIDGSVDFIEPNNVVPIFHIQAETFTKGYRVRLNLDGSADNLTLALFSDPPLTDIDIMTLLTSGQISGETEGLEGGIGAGEATAFLTGRLQDVMEERFKYITGLERFEVDPHTTSSGAVSSKITVGKRMLGERLLATYSSSIGSTELDVIKLQYNLTRKFSIIGSRNEVGSIGADFRYRFEFK